MRAQRVRRVDNRFPETLRVRRRRQWRAIPLQPATMIPSLRFVLSFVVLSFLASNGVSAQYPYDDPPSPPPPSPSPPPPNRPPPPEPPLRPPLFPGYTSLYAPVVCQNECEWANNDVCEDGGPGSSYSDCNLCAAPSLPELNPCVSLTTADQTRACHIVRKIELTTEPFLVAQTDPMCETLV